MPSLWIGDWYVWLWEKLGKTIHVERKTALNLVGVSSGLWLFGLVLACIKAWRYPHHVIAEMAGARHYAAAKTPDEKFAVTCRRYSLRPNAEETARLSLTSKGVMPAQFPGDGVYPHTANNYPPEKDFNGG